MQNTGCSLCSKTVLQFTKASEAGKTARLNRTGCEISNKEKKVVATATRVGNLYYLEYCRKGRNVNVAESNDMWHRRYGHISEQSLANNKLAKYYKCNSAKNIGFCESCIQHCTSFDGTDRQTGDLLELVHSDVCGKISETSIGGAQYFLTFTDDKFWVYILKTKDQVLEHFVE